MPVAGTREVQVSLEKEARHIVDAGREQRNPGVGDIGESIHGLPHRQRFIERKHNRPRGHDALDLENVKAHQVLDHPKLFRRQHAFFHPSSAMAASSSRK